MRQKMFRAHEFAYIVFLQLHTEGGRGSNILKAPCSVTLSNKSTLPLLCTTEWVTYREVQRGGYQVVFVLWIYATTSHLGMELRWHHVCRVSNKLLQEENRLWKFLCGRILLQQLSLCLFPCRELYKYHTLDSLVGACLGPQRKNSEDSIMICPHSAVSGLSLTQQLTASHGTNRTELQDSKW